MNPTLLQLPTRCPTPWRGALACAILLTACGGAALVIPLFEFLFRASDVTDQGTTYSVQLSLAPTRPTSASGTFTGGNFQVEDGLGGFAEAFISGSFDSCTLELNLGAEPPAPLASTYSGRFQGRDTLVLTPSDRSGRPVMTLRRSNAELLSGTMDC